MNREQCILINTYLIRIAERAGYFCGHMDELTAIDLEEMLSSVQFMWELAAKADEGTMSDG